MPAAPSRLRSTTARRNDASSRDPVADAGEADCTGNATRHDICAARLGVEGAAARRLAGHVAVAMRDWSPETDYEQRLVHDIAVISLKLAQLDTLELKALDAAIEGSEARFPAMASLARYRHALKREQDEVTARLSAVQEDRWALEDAAAEAALAEAEARAAAAKSRQSEPERRGASVHLIRYH